MASLLEITVPEKKLEELLELARSGGCPVVKVPYDASPAELREEALKVRGLLLAQIVIGLSELLGSDEGKGKEGEG